MRGKHFPPSPNDDKNKLKLFTKNRHCSKGEILLFKHLKLFNFFKTTINFSFQFYCHSFICLVATFVEMGKQNDKQEFYLLAPIQRTLITFTSY